MFNLKALFRSRSLAISLNKAEKDLLRYFISNKTAFDDWLPARVHQYPKIRFVFYYPTAIDFYFDGFKLFTVYFKKDLRDNLMVTELKMSEVNFNTIRSADWKPFQELMIAFLSYLEEKQTLDQLQEQRALHEYKSLCTGEGPLPTTAGSYIRDVLATQLH